METTTGSNYSEPPNSYPPSVPLCVYRELTAELEAVQSKLDVVTNHNQKLTQENQQLRQEINKVIQSCLELQKLIGTPAPSPPTPPSNHNEIEYQPQPKISHHNEIRYTNKPSVKTSSPRQNPNSPRTKSGIKKTPPQNRRYQSPANIMDMNFPASETVFIEEEQVSHYPHRHSENKGLNGWWLAITIVFIMLTGFAAGYLIVRPLFQNQR